MDDLEIYQADRGQGRGEVISVQDALIEEIRTQGRDGFVTVSYGVMGNAGIIFVELVTLVVNRDTAILDVFGNQLAFRDLRVGMRVDADFSARMTRSIPPQAVAFRIVVRPVSSAINIKIDRVVSVDTNNGFLYTGNPDDIYDQMRFVVTDATVILDRRGNRIRLNQIRPGQLVRVEHANFQTASIPPQTTAFLIQVL